jgi:molecular chaperone Hsp33
MDEPKDSIFRGMTDDGAFRIVTLRATQTVAGVITAQGARGNTARHLGDLVAGSVLVRETMSPGLRVQGILKRRDQPGYLLGDSHPSGKTRGLASGQAAEGSFEMKNALLQMVRTLQDGRIQQGVVAVPDDASVSAGLMAYMQESEQITTMIVVGTLFEDGLTEEGDATPKVKVCGGYLIQLLPGVGRGPLAIMTERLEDFRNIDPMLLAEGFTPKALADELLWGMPYTELEQSSFDYDCWCSRASMLGALASLNRDEVSELVTAGQVLEISCDYCHRDFNVTPAELQGLLESN